MSRFTQPRRWAALHRRHKLGQISEFDITPDEARTALYGVLMANGYEFDENLGCTESYNPKTDEFACKVWCPNEHKLIDTYVRGEGVGAMVKIMREMAGTMGKRLLHPSEIKRLARDQHPKTAAQVTEMLRAR